MSLTDYVQYRNGVPLGASGSLQNMLVRSFGAGTFAKFWQYWNPIWGYSLGRYIYAPLNQFLPSSVSLILTFIISGGIHDLATMLVRGSPAFFFTPWFFLMGIIVVVGRLLKLDYSKQTFQVRVAINVTSILVCLMIAIGMKRFCSASHPLTIGMVIEAATELPLAEAYRVSIYEPLGMESTFMDCYEDAVVDVVHGYTSFGDDLTDVTELHESVSWSAGGMTSTASDLVTFVRGLFAGELVDLARIQ